MPISNYSHCLYAVSFRGQMKRLLWTREEPAQCSTSTMRRKNWKVKEGFFLFFFGNATILFLPCIHLHLVSCVRIFLHKILRNHDTITSLLLKPLKLLPWSRLLRPLTGCSPSPTNQELLFQHRCSAEVHLHSNYLHSSNLLSRWRKSFST